MRGFGARFFVSLKDDFRDRCAESLSGTYLFEGLENPYLKVRDRLTPGKSYPVMNIENDGREVAILDDRGRLLLTEIALFKFAGDGDDENPLNSSTRPIF